MLWAGGGFLPGQLGVGVRRGLGSEGGARGMQAAGVRLGGVRASRCPLRPGLRKDQESHLALCAHDTWFTHSCGHEADAGAICSGEGSQRLPDRMDHDSK